MMSVQSDPHAVGGHCAAVNAGRSAVFGEAVFRPMRHGACHRLLQLALLAAIGWVPGAAAQAPGAAPLEEVAVVGDLGSLPDAVQISPSIRYTNLNTATIKPTSIMTVAI